MESAYGPFVAELARRLEREGVDVPDAPRERANPSADYKRRLLAAAVARFGLPYLEEMGRPFAGFVGHPFISALRAADSAASLLRRWQRLEVLAHSENRVRALEVEVNRVRLARERRAGGAPTLAEDTLIAGMLAGLLEAVGADAVRVANEGEAALPEAALPEAALPDAAPAGARVWTLRWTRWRPPEAAPAAEPWGVGSDFARAAFALLLDDPGLPLATVAQALHVSTRSLQRRLGEASTTYQSLVRMARIALAGGTLARAKGAQPSLTSVAHACGFADSAHLSREFRALVGIQPRRFSRALGPGTPGVR